MRRQARERLPEEQEDRLDVLGILRAFAAMLAVWALLLGMLYYAAGWI